MKPTGRNVQSSLEEKCSSTKPIHCIKALEQDDLQRG